MATVVITFFLFVQFCVCKMDADCIERQRDQRLSRREKRWSMSSQRIDEIVAVLMRPISSDSRRCFDTDLAALLEEYLTEAGLHALEAGDAAAAAAAAAPNYAELALLLQQSAAIYGRKVDYLYQHVLDVSESLHAPPESAEEVPLSPSAGRQPGAAPAAAPPAGQPGAPRGLQAFQRLGFLGVDPERIAYTPANNRPHPQLPNTFTELEPRVMTASSWGALYDYDHEFIGLPDDFTATIDTFHSETGMLLDDFEHRTLFDPEGPRPISLRELQEAIEAAAPPLTPEPLSPQSERATPPGLASPALAGPAGAAPSSPLRTSTPLPAAPAPAPAPALAPAAPDAPVQLALPTPVKKERKRRHSVNNIGDFEGGLKLRINEDLQRWLSKQRDFSLPNRWISSIVNKRKSYILSERRRLRELEPDPPAEFAGWSSAEAAEAAARVKSWRALELDSDDDGFFEQSSVGDGFDTSRVEDATRVDDTTRIDDTTRADDTSHVDSSGELSRADSSGVGSAEGAEWASWQAGVLSRAAAAEARGALDVRALGRAVLAALPPAGARAFPDVLRRAARAHHEVSHVLLATLFLANAGNVRVLPGAPLSRSAFSLQLLSHDERLYSAAAAADADQFLR